MGLGLSEAVFNSNGDAEHIHHVVLEKFPVLESCGGYTLLRLAENSHSMVEIEGPDSGMTVPYLKDILNQAKLYIRPLQKDISEEDMKPYSFLNVRNIDDCCHTSWYLSGLFYSENAMHCRLVCAMNEPTWFWC